MRPVNEWDEEYVRQLPRGEFDWIEFKGRGGLDFTLPSIAENKVLEKLSIQVSAMANSGGGTIVYGMTDPTDLSAREVDDGGISLHLKGRNTKEWLEDVIPHLVEEPLRRFSVLALTRSAGAPSAEDGRGIFVIDIADSHDAPHQARDSRYYVRVGGKSRPAGHRIVSDIFNRGNHAEFHVDLSIYSETWIPSDPLSLPIMMGSERSPRRSVHLVLTATNRGTVFAQFVRVFVSIPERFVPSDERDDDDVVIIDGVRHFQFAENNQKRDVVGHTMGYPKYGGSWFDPILPGLSRSWKFSLHPGLRPQHMKNEHIYWSIHADSAPAAQGRAEFAKLPFEVRDNHVIE